VIHLLDTNILSVLIKRHPPQVNVREFRRIEGLRLVDWATPC